MLATQIELSFRLQCRYRVQVKGWKLSKAMEERMMGSRRMVSADELEKVREHLRYELDMLVRAAGLVEKYNPEKAKTDEGRIIGNALIESFAIHARNLKEFFFHSPKDDGARAEHFFRDPETWKSNRGTMPHDLKVVDQMANKQISHLTYARTALSESEYRWNFHGIATAIHDTMTVFRRLIESQGTGTIAAPQASCFSAAQSPSKSLIAKTGCSTIASPAQLGVYPGMQARTAPENRQDDIHQL